ncbi:hypothetical protein LMG28614_00732 [Paraburkholderia ultramafica]|uniref:Uncharacterized protein n=1 Tax=Paraburkholderia ultramafica TaxID=1544867 RepID=A0A6S7B287_9BURK|nr:hypothetical protein [Paraburkholderia ultramafica]CAB3778786.1 hypothetical protein LMG28614_00732 [Paraburkholderia ultramafica]
MPDILIRHCTIRIVRRGGWAWGREPRALLDRVLDRLPALIAGEMEQLWPGDEEREISAPIRVHLPVSLAGLLAASDLAGETGLPGSAPSHELLRSLRLALRQALAAEIDSEGGERSAGDETIEAERPEPGPREIRAPLEPLAVLVSWLRNGRLQARLSSFAPDALSAWHAHIFATPIVPSANPAAIAELAERLAERLMARPPCTESDVAGTLRLRLHAFVALEATMPGCLGSAVLRDTVERLLPCHDIGPVTAPSIEAPTVPTAVVDAAAPPQAASSAAGAASLPALRIAHRTLRGVPQEQRIDCALPFLLLGPLARIGFLDTASAVFAAVGLPEALPLLAVALAYKTMDPPARAWLRLPATRKAAAACGLLAEPPDDNDIVALARAVSRQLSPLDALVEDCLLDGHRPGTPLLVTRAGGAANAYLLLWDVEGLFPIAIMQNLLPVLQRMLHELVLIPVDVATPSVLHALDAASIRFVTDAPPCRGERWRRVAGKGRECWWTNDTLMAEERLAAAGRRLAEATELADASWQALGVERPSVPRQAGDAFDRCVTLAAGLALGSIAWELWWDREPTAPPLALNRFRDLGGLMRVNAESVRILLPLGRRFFDLRDHGFLDDVHDIPWFDGRVLCFSSG